MADLMTIFICKVPRSSHLSPLIAYTYLRMIMKLFLAHWHSKVDDILTYCNDTSRQLNTSINFLHLSISKGNNRNRFVVHNHKPP